MEISPTLQRLCDAQTRMRRANDAWSVGIRPTGRNGRNGVEGWSVPGHLSEEVDAARAELSAAEQAHIDAGRPVFVAKGPATQADVQTKYLEDDTEDIVHTFKQCARSMLFWAARNEPETGRQSVRGMLRRLRRRLARQ